MSRSARTARPTTRRLLPRVEPLESRRLFTVSAGTGYFGPLPPAAISAFSDPSADLSTLSVVSTDPQDGAVIADSPGVINVTFNQPFDPTSVSFDFGLLEVDSDGAVLSDQGGLLMEPFDLTGEPTVLPITVAGLLAPGRYQIVLLGSFSMLAGVPQDGNPGAPLGASGVDQVVATFTIAPPGPAPVPAETLADAVDLGTVGPLPASTAGTLDLDANAGDYHLYKFTLAPGHFWRFGAEVSADRDGSPLNSALALFDAQGRLLKTDDVGRADAPNDPYLFSGLGAGTYYLGISGTQNLPDLPGGYDPVAGQFGPAGQPQAGGPYRLTVLAQAEDSPTELADFRLTYADPLDPRPTGVVLTFSGPMDIASFKAASGLAPGDPFTGLQAIGKDGQVWYLTPVSYDESHNQFAFLFSQPLPKGKYRLVVPDEGGVTDLAGLTPTARGHKHDGGGRDGGGDGHDGDGHGKGHKDDGVLASFEVKRTKNSTVPDDLGVVVGGPADGAHGHSAILPGQTVTYRFVAPAAGFYKLFGDLSAGTISIQTIGDDGIVTQGALTPASTNGQFMNLQEGVYYLQLTNTGAEPTDLVFTLYRVPVSADAVFDNGVGQGPALNLVLINAEPLAPPTGPVPIPSDVFAGPQPFAGGSTPAAPTGHSAGSVVAATDVESPGDSGLILTLGNSLVGSPSATAEQVAAVGPGTQAGVTALAANTPGVLQGITYGQSLSRVSPYGDVVTAESDPEAPTVEGEEQPMAPDESAPVDGALVAKQEPAAPDQDEQALAAATDWLGGLGSVVLDWLGARPRPTAEPASDARPGAEPIALMRDGLVHAEPEQVEHADLATPLGLSVLSVLVMRVRQPVRRWMGRRGGQRGRRISAAKTAVKGPHARI